MTLEEYHQYNFLGEFSPGIRYMTNESKINLRGSVVEASVTTSRVMPEVNDVEDSINWVDRGAVTPVKNQGMCGACKFFDVCDCYLGFLLSL
jgi:C1A family cysteine protease